MESSSLYTYLLQYYHNLWHFLGHYLSHSQPTHLSSALHSVA